MNPKLNFDKVLPRLQRSKFRMRFKLDQNDLSYIDKGGLEKIKLHAADFIKRRLAPAIPRNDGNQTPLKGHPVFKAQHATGTCCRACLSKWYSVPKGRALTSDECEGIVSVLLDWIEWNKGDKGL